MPLKLRRQISSKEPKMHLMKSLFILVILIIPLGLDTLSAQPGRSGRGQDSRPSRQLGTALISAANGDVRAHDARTGDWVSAHASMVLENRDRLATGLGSRAELQFDVANFARLNSETEVLVGDLGNRSYHISVTQGELTYSMWKHGEADVLIEAGEVRIRPLKPGVYRISTDEGLTTVTVRKGAAELESPAGIRRVEKGKRLTIDKRNDKQRIRAASAPGKDPFDKWSERRDDVLRRDGPRSNWRRGGRLYAYGGYPYHLGLGYYPYRRFGFGRSFSRHRYRGRRRW